MYHHGYGPDNLNNLAWKRRLEGRDYTLQNTGPPSSVEEQRVTRAFWCTQILYDLKKAAAQCQLS
jgi:hypothetical protein